MAVLIIRDQADTYADEDLSYFSEYVVEKLKAVEAPEPPLNFWFWEKLKSNDAQCVTFTTLLLSCLQPLGKDVEATGISNRTMAQILRNTGICYVRKKGQRKYKATFWPDLEFIFEDCTAVGNGENLSGLKEEDKSVRVRFIDHHSQDTKWENEVTESDWRRQLKAKRLGLILQGLQESNLLHKFRHIYSGCWLGVGGIGGFETYMLGDTVEIPLLVNSMTYMFSLSFPVTGIYLSLPAFFLRFLVLPFITLNVTFARMKVRNNLAGQIRLQVWIIFVYTFFTLGLYFSCQILSNFPTEVILAARFSLIASLGLGFLPFVSWCLDNLKYRQNMLRIWRDFSFLDLISG